MARNKTVRGYKYTPDEWENVQNQISATISLIETHIIPDMPGDLGEKLHSYLIRMQAACKPRMGDTQEVEQA